MERNKELVQKDDIKSLITKIKYIQIAEALKSPKDIDAALVSECADFVLEAENRQKALTPDEIKTLVRLIPFKNTKLQADRMRIFKSVIIAAVILALLAITCMAVKPIRNFFAKVTADGTFFNFGISDDDDYLCANYSFIPEGYALVYDDTVNDIRKITYENNEKLIYIVSSENENTLKFINSENATETGEVAIGKYIGYYCINKDQTFLVWSTGKYNHAITADNCKYITLDLLVNIALSREKQ